MNDPIFLEALRKSFDRDDAAEEEAHDRLMKTDYKYDVEAIQVLHNLSEALLRVTRNYAKKWNFDIDEEFSVRKQETPSLSKEQMKQLTAAAAKAAQRTISGGLPSPEELRSWPVNDPERQQILTKAELYRRHRGEFMEYAREHALALAAGLV